MDPKFKTDQTPAQIIYYQWAEWKEMTPRTFTQKIRGLVIDLHKKLKLFYLPMKGIVPPGYTKRGFYYNDAGKWKLLLGDHETISAITLAGLNIWLEGEDVKLTATNALIQAELDEIGAQNANLPQNAQKHPCNQF